MRKVLLALTALSLLTAAPAMAATKPTKATLDAAHPSVTFSGNTGPFVDPYNNVADGCSDIDKPNCDHIALSVDAGGKNVKITVVPSSPAEDIDVYVYDSKGKLVGQSGNNPGATEIVYLKAPAKGVYDVRISPFLTVASGAYKGTAKLA